MVSVHFLFVCFFLSFPVQLRCILMFLMVIIINGVILILDFIWGFKKCIILEPSKAALLESSLLPCTWMRWGEVLSVQWKIVVKNHLILGGHYWSSWILMFQIVIIMVGIIFNWNGFYLRCIPWSSLSS